MGVFVFCLMQIGFLARAFQTEVWWRSELAKIEDPLPLWKPEGGSPGEPECWASFLHLPVVPAVQECRVVLQQGCRGRAEGEILGLGCSVSRV